MTASASSRAPAARDHMRALVDLFSVVGLFLNGRADEESLRAAHKRVQDVRVRIADGAFRGSQGGFPTASEAVGGGGATPQNGAQESGEPPRTSRSRKSESTSERSEEKGRSWLSEYGEAWKARYGTPVVPWGQLAKALGELHKADKDETLRRFRNYLAATPGRFANPFRFAQTFGEWAGARDLRETRDPLDQLDGEDLDAYVARLHRMTSK